MRRTVNFLSDNASGVSGSILKALGAVNDGFAAGYGDDAVSGRLGDLFSGLFERPVASYPVVTGTAANALSLATIVPPHGAVLCHREAHISVHECGAPEFYSGGAKLILLDGAAGKIVPEAVAAALAPLWRGSEHMVQPAALSITQATEFGAVYSPREIKALCDHAHGEGLLVHMDGARFANAVAHLGCAPADITWRAGVDVLSFGATKNGAMAAEAVIWFDPDMAGDFRYRRKRGGHLISKMRYLSAQLEAYLADGLWLKTAAHANLMATRLGAALAEVETVQLECPIEANMVFAWVPEAMAARLAEGGLMFHAMGARPGQQLIRLVCSFSTPDQDIDAALALIRCSAGV